MVRADQLQKSKDSPEHFHVDALSDRMENFAAYAFLQLLFHDQPDAAKGWVSVRQPVYEIDGDVRESDPLADLVQNDRNTEPDLRASAQRQYTPKRKEQRTDDPRYTKQMNCSIVHSQGA